MPMTHPSFIAALHSDRPAADRADRLALYGQFLGDWEMHGAVHADDGATSKGEGEIHFGYVLAGRAIQDVWIFADLFYGTTLRIYDPNIDAWHILWSDPVRQFYRRQIGRAQGADIVQLGKDDAGLDVRWRFTEITPRSFHWLGERSANGGVSWDLQAEFFARRVG